MPGLKYFFLLFHCYWLVLIGSNSHQRLKLVQMTEFILFVGIGLV